MKFARTRLVSNSPITAIRCPFLIPELLCYLLEILLIPLQIPELPKPSEEQRTLATLARTCRAFSEPSLDCLWRCLNSLLPLVRCFANVVDEDRVKTPPSRSEWLIIERYAPRIRDLTLGTEHLSLHFLQFTGLVLPNLRVFRWKCHSVPGYHRFLSFPWPWLSTQIVAIEVELKTTRDPNYPLFLEHYYPMVCSNLESIRLNFLYEVRDHSTVSKSLSVAICSNAAWKHVALSPPIDYVVLRHLGISSTLKTISLKLAPQESLPYCFDPQDIPFRNVTELALTLGNSLNFVTCLLRPRDQAFHHFSVTLYTLAFPLEVSTLLTALASPQRMRSLQSVVIDHIPYIVSRSISDMEGTTAHQHFTYETFHPLVSLVHLRELVIHLNDAVSLDDDEFATLVRHWPLLEVLNMTWVFKERPVASVTLNGLLSLLASCRKLREISLTLDARDIPTGTYAHSDVRCPLITSPITMCNSPLECPESVAEFLFTHLPCVTGVRPTLIWIWIAQGDMYSHPSYKPLWSEVDRHVKRLQAAPKRAVSLFGRLRFVLGVRTIKTSALHRLSDYDDD